MTKKPVQRKRQPDKKISAFRGQWTADVEGRELAVLHNTWRVGTTGYFDPMKKAGSEADKHKRLKSALEANDVAVMQRDMGDEALTRDAFIGLFSYKDLKIGDDGSITLTLVDRVQ